MSESKTHNLPLASLVLLMICLSIAGSILAGVLFFATDRTAQEKMLPPENANYPCAPNDCDCQTQRCQSSCPQNANPSQCMQDCYVEVYLPCKG